MKTDLKEEPEENKEGPDTVQQRQEIQEGCEDEVRKCKEDISEDKRPQIRKEVLCPHQGICQERQDRACVEVVRKEIVYSKVRLRSTGGVL